MFHSCFQGNRRCGVCALEVVIPQHVMLLSFAPDEDLHSRNIVLLQSTVLREMLNITTDM